jgi:hypothetical protein
MSANGSKGSLARRLEALEQLITYRPPQLIVVTAKPGSEEAAIAAIKPRPTDADTVVVVRTYLTDPPAEQPPVMCEPTEIALEPERKPDEHENPQD